MFSSIDGVAGNHLKNYISKIIEAIVRSGKAYWRTIAERKREREKGNVG